MSAAPGLNDTPFRRLGVPGMNVDQWVPPSVVVMMNPGFKGPAPAPPTAQPWQASAKVTALKRYMLETARCRRQWAPPSVVARMPVLPTAQP